MNKHIHKVGITEIIHSGSDDAIAKTAKRLKDSIFLNKWERNPNSRQALPAQRVPSIRESKQIRLIVAKDLSYIESVKEVMNLLKISQATARKFYTHVKKHK